MTISLDTATIASRTNAPADIMLACDDLYCDPFDPIARDRVQALLIPGLDATISDRSGLALPLARAQRSTLVSPPTVQLPRTSAPAALTSGDRGCPTSLSSRYPANRGAAVATTTRAQNTNASRAKGECAMSPSTSDQQSTDVDYALVREYSRDLKIACDELHDNPFDTAARETLKTLIAERSPVADAALDRLTAQQSTPAPRPTR